ncbi:hypothetical protein [Nocardia cyriacigeorgica]|uniref:hypothetical protein n=1 Tax=Nocardia cyriacigeorgica TaxID=135487 RepID=UPI0024551095|nr:hypothetical protein [Nocardia cyriacigeorgica]
MLGPRAAAGPAPATADQLAERPRSPLTALSPVLLPLMALPGPAARMARVVPGLHW